MGKFFFLLFVVVPPLRFSVFGALAIFPPGRGPTNCMPYQSCPATEEERRRFASMDKFVYTLRKLPRFEVKLGRLGCVGGEFIQKRVDIALAADLVRLSCGRMIQKAVLVTGDSDFMPAIEAAKDAGVLVTLYYSQSSIHDELLSAVDESAVMDQELISHVTR